MEGVYSATSEGREESGDLLKRDRGIMNSLYLSYVFNKTAHGFKIINCNEQEFFAIGKSCK